MANEDLMAGLPDNIKPVSTEGPFFIERHPGSYSVILLTKRLVTCGGEGSEDRATQLAQALNRVWTDNIGSKRILCEELKAESIE